MTAPSPEERPIRIVQIGTDYTVHPDDLPRLNLAVGDTFGLAYHEGSTGLCFTLTVNGAVIPTVFERTHP